MHHVLLIPGFFGFANFGDIKYYSYVHEVLMAAFQRRGEKVTIHDVLTLPTASLPQRAAAIADTLAGLGAGLGDGGGGDSRVHLIGHSTGGLDARLFCSPGVALPCAHDVDALAARVDSVISVATPHHGAPMASLLASLSGQRLLRVLSLLTLHGTRIGSIPLPALVALIGYLPRIGRAQGPILTILDQVYSHLLREFDETRRLEIEEFFTSTTSDQNLLPQLGVEAMQVFNAAATRRATTRYGCVVTQARPPTWRTAMNAGFSPTVQAVHALYRGLYQLAAGNELSLSPLHASHISPLRAAYGQLPSMRSNDAIVPTRSQIWGDLIHAVWADHLDVIGHFSGSDLTPPHVDWISTHSGFSRQAFETLWGDVVDYALAGKRRS